MTSGWLVFVGVCAAVSVSPGPAVLYIVTRTLDQGLGAGLASIAGISAGGTVHVFLAAFGVAAAAAAWPLSLLIVQVLGAGYLVWLGLLRIRAAGKAIAAAAGQSALPLLAIFRDGVIVNLTNPKTVLFLLAFLPQFVDRDAGALSGQLLVLGLTFVLVATLTDCAYVLAAGQLRHRLARGRARSWPGWFAGGVYILLGLVGIVDAARRLFADGS